MPVSTSSKYLKQKAPGGDARGIKDGSVDHRNRLYTNQPKRIWLNIF